MQDANPIIVDLGKKRSKVIKALKRGRGKALYEVSQALDEVRAGVGAEAEGKVFVPVVLIYRRKVKKRRGILSSL